MKKIHNFKCDSALQESPLTIANGETVPVFSITSYHALVQCVGYAKYLNRNSGNVYLRGQDELYPSLIPSLYRNMSSFSAYSTANHHLNLYVQACADQVKLIQQLDAEIRKPIFQHYGIHTRWLDVVDNLWIAIWFGIHKWHTVILNREYKNVTIRQSGPTEFMYLILICADAINEGRITGMYEGHATCTVDLRKAAPSIFLRPHAQHALLMRSKNLRNIEDHDMSNRIIGIVKLKVEDCIKWIGSDGLCSARNLFPPANFDHGYGVLLEQLPNSSNTATVKKYGSVYTVTY